MLRTALTIAQPGPAPDPAPCSVDIEATHRRVSRPPPSCTAVAGESRLALGHHHPGQPPPIACCTDIDTGCSWASTRPARTGRSRALPLQHGTYHPANDCNIGEMAVTMTEGVHSAADHPTRLARQDGSRRHTRRSRTNHRAHRAWSRFRCLSRRTDQTADPVIESWI
jgi:hypothetical protein